MLEFHNDEKRGMTYVSSVNPSVWGKASVLFCFHLILETENRGYLAVLKPRAGSDLKWKKAMCVISPCACLCVCV